MYRGWGGGGADVVFCPGLTLLADSKMEHLLPMEGGRGGGGGVGRGNIEGGAEGDCIYTC